MKLPKGDKSGSEGVGSQAGEETYTEDSVLGEFSEMGAIM